VVSALWKRKYNLLYLYMHHCHIPHGSLPPLVALAGTSLQSLFASPGLKESQASSIPPPPRHGCGEGSPAASLGTKLAVWS